MPQPSFFIRMINTRADSVVREVSLGVDLELLLVIRRDLRPAVPVEHPRPPLPGALVVAHEVPFELVLRSHHRVHLFEKKGT